MAKKLIKKSKCKFDHGYIVKDGEIIGIPENVWLQLNKLEIMVQQYYYLRDQGPARRGPSLEGFVRKSDIKPDRPYIDAPDTPVTDKRVAEAMEFMREVDCVNKTDEVNEAIDAFGALIDWLSDNKFVEGTCTQPIDTFMLGNPLMLSPNGVVSFIEMMVKHDILMEV